ncbi:tetratricopeptide repeat protein [Adhaeribacter soli]|uniref:Tetratricopeptide repeat protein n=1 Tax=Adhaeribacter soli TaxID=2607655 RepID=A0A5N1IUT9_9BACT|nr:hypothetical protein [Adhaeribacter soli]KAA9332876.1 hypothetical protein F0P94_12850 [Adhaeribacter soli]
MRKRITQILFTYIFWMVAGQAVLAGNSKTETLLQEANELFASAKDNLALQKFEQALELEPDCYEALWKSSLLNSRIGLRYSDLLTQQKYFEKAWSYADAALCVNPEDAESNYVMALAVYNKANVLGVKERMLRSKVIKFHLDAALNADPAHADAWQLMGRWNFKNANLSKPEKAAVNMFFGGVSLDASNEKAVEALQKAISYNPANISYYYDLACVYRELQKMDLVEVTLLEASELKILTTEELEVSRRCQAMLREIQKA